MKIIDTATLLIRLGWRNILRHGRRSLLVASSTMVGVTGVLLTMALTNGFFDSMLTVGIKSGLGHVQIRPEGFNETRKIGSTIADPASIDERLRDFTRKRTYFSKRLEREGLLRLASFSRGVVLIGIDPESERSTSIYREWLGEGRFFGKGEGGSTEIAGVIPCLIGGMNADRMGITAGDWAVLSVTGPRGEYRSVRCGVVGILRPGIEPFEKYTVLLLREDLSRLYSDTPDRVGYYVFVGEDIEETGPLQRVLIEQMNGIPGIEILSYGEIEKTMSKVIELSDQWTWIVYLLLLLGVVLIMFDSITMSVFERMQEIGILRAIGSGPWMLFWMVIFESVLLAMIGALVGTAFSLLLSGFFYVNGLSLAAFAEGMETFTKSGSTVYPYLTFENIFDGFYYTFIISLLSGFYPAYRAVRISPVKAIYNR